MQAGGCFDIIFTIVVMRLHQANRLDVTIIHGDGTTTASKKGVDNIGFNPNLLVSKTITP